MIFDTNKWNKYVKALSVENLVKRVQEHKLYSKLQICNFHFNPNFDPIKEVHELGIFTALGLKLLSVFDNEKAKVGGTSYLIAYSKIHFEISRSFVYFVNELL